MGKQGEIDYLENLGEAGRQHALDKPFSDSLCPRYLIELGVIMNYLPPVPAKLLDLGCGSGWTSVFYARRGYDVIGQDIAPDMIDLANENKVRFGVSNLQFCVSDYEDLPFSDEFDAAIFYDSLHHSVDERAAIRAVHRALKPGGVLITLEPGVGHATSPTSIDAAKKFGVTERDMPPRLILRAAKEVGFAQHCVKINPMLIHNLFYGRGRHSRFGILARFKIIRALAVACAIFYIPKGISSLVVLEK